MELYVGFTIIVGSICFIVGLGLTEKNAWGKGYLAGYEDAREDTAGVTDGSETRLI